MTQYLIDTTIEQSVDFLAHRKVGLAHGVVPSLGKLASYKKADEPAPGAAPAPSTEPGAAPDAGGGTLASLLANPSVQAALAGTGIGGIVGLLAGLRRKKERRNLLRDSLTGAVAGGVGLGGLSLAANAFSGGGAPTAESVGLPGPSNEAVTAWRAQLQSAGLSEAQIDAKLVSLAKQLSPRELTEWLGASGSSSVTQYPMVEALKDLVGTVRDTGGGAARFAANQFGDVKSNPADPSGYGDVASQIGGYSTLALAGDQLTKLRARADISNARIRGISDQIPAALHTRVNAVPGTPGTPGTSGTSAVKGTPAVELTLLQAQQNQLREMFDKHLTDMNPASKAVVEAGFSPGATDLQRLEFDKLMTGGDKAAAGMVDNFLNEVGRQEGRYMQPKDGPRWAGIATPGERLSLTSSALQRGKVPLLNRFIGMNPVTRKGVIPESPKVRIGMPKTTGGWTGLATLGTILGTTGWWTNKEHDDRIGAGNTQDILTGELNSRAGNK